MKLTPQPTADSLEGAPIGRMAIDKQFLQHSGTMTRGAPQLNATVVPDSGTGELVGLAGRMAITIADGKHSYEFEYPITGPP